MTRSCAEPDLVRTMKSLCVFCGSCAGVRPEYHEVATALGAAIAKRGLRLVYGGASVGLMGALANGALEAGGDVIGVLPHHLAGREVGHLRLTRLELVDTMHERKARMMELSDAFVALPGGIGTFEELFEVWTWGQLGLHRKPCAILNVADYYSPLIRFLDSGVDEGFVRPAYRAMLVVAASVPELFDALTQYQPPVVPAWLTSPAELAPSADTPSPTP